MLEIDQACVSLPEARSGRLHTIVNNISLTVGCGLGDGASGLISTSSAGPSCTGSSSPVIAHQCSSSEENIEAF